MFAELPTHSPTPQEVAEAKAKVDREYRAIFAAERERQAADPRHIAQVHHLAVSRVTAIDRAIRALIEQRQAAIELYDIALHPGDIRPLDELLADLANPRAS